ncbi:unnamed protein product [Ranitomeya imitator]|uniref:CRAL-TRIO domain-containing protein n=1 Tax=Ranitomeya imitator TaxID=111125 RepID=A0ABN9LJD8_9NEOB|nr:unnamed protein product [Ranitomeya imitator]
MDKSDYLEEVFRQLNDISFYKIISYNPLSQIAQKIKPVVDFHLPASTIDSKMRDFLIKTDPIIPIFYILPKIHKRLLKPPGRPIVSLTDSILSPLAIVLEKILTPLFKSTQSFLLDTNEFIRVIRSLGPLFPTSFLITWDVNRLYTSITHEKGLMATDRLLSEAGVDGYYGDGLNAIIVFAVCFMPDSSQPNYRYLMDNLFKYVIGTLEMLVAENYMIVYLNGATTRRKMPSLGWLRRCYQQIDRRLRKNLKSLIIVHPSWFIRTLLAITKPFISSKFSQKIKYVFSLVELAELIPMEYVVIPDCIKDGSSPKSSSKTFGKLLVNFYEKSTSLFTVDKELNKKTEDQANVQ